MEREKGDASRGGREIRGGGGRALERQKGTAG